MAREDDVCAFGQSALVTVGTGATLAFLVNPIAGEVSSILKYFSGGSLEIVPAPLGTTALGGSLVALEGTGYLMGTSEALNIAGPARYYLIAKGATTLAYLLRGRSAGF